MSYPIIASIEKFPTNTHANYKVKLASQLMLKEDYEVALVEAFFLKDWHNIIQDDGTLTISSRGVAHEFVIDSGLYEKSQSAIRSNK